MIRPMGYTNLRRLLPMLIASALPRVGERVQAIRDIVKLPRRHPRGR